MQYRPLLKKAWAITRKNKFLWIFGFFIVIFFGGGGDFEMLIKYVNDTREGTSWFYIIQSGEGYAQMARASEKVQIFFQNYGVVSWALIAIAVILGVFVLWVISAAQGSLIYSVMHLHKGKVTAKMEMNRAMTEGKKHAWTLLSLNLLQKFLILFAIFLVTLPLAAATGKSAGDESIFALTSLTLFVLFPLSIVINFILKYASIFAVTKGLHFRSAVSHAWKLFKENWLISIEVAFILFVIYTAVGAVVVFILGIASVPFVVLSLLVSSVSAAFLVVMALYTVLFLVLIILFASILSTFEYATWTLTFQELIQGKKKSSHLNRILHPVVGGGHEITSTKKSANV